MALPDNLSPEECDLGKGCIRGDRQAQRHLYEQYAPVMYGVCLRNSGHKEEATDLLQEGFIKVFTKISCFSGNGSFEGWMWRIFVNTAIEAFRSITNLSPIRNIKEEEPSDEALDALNKLAVQDIILNKKAKKDKPVI